MAVENVKIFTALGVGATLTYYCRYTAGGDEHETLVMPRNRWLDYAADVRTLDGLREILYGDALYHINGAAKWSAQAKDELRRQTDRVAGDLWEDTHAN